MPRTLGRPAQILQPGRMSILTIREPGELSARCKSVPIRSHDSLRTEWLLTFWSIAESISCFVEMPEPVTSPARLTKITRVESTAM
jgi:hypothetical protein